MRTLFARGLAGSHILTHAPVGSVGGVSRALVHLRGVPGVQRRGKQAYGTEIVCPLISQTLLAGTNGMTNVQAEASRVSCREAPRVRLGQKRWLVAARPCTRVFPRCT